MSSTLSISIPGCQVGEAFVTFTIVVNKGESSWSVRRRYQDFVKLHGAIKKVASSSSGASGGDLPDLPPKKLRMGLSKFAPDFVEERRLGLELYLQAVVAIVDPERCEPLDDFLVYAEHWLREAVEELAKISELQHVVKVLRQAADAAASVHTKRTGSGAVGRRKAAADSDDEEEGGGDAPPASSADGPELLSLLKDVVRMLGEYAGMVKGGAEDAEERSEATAASNSALTSKLRARQEDIADARQMMEALREARSKECDKERTQLALVGGQVRMVAAELARVQADSVALTTLTEEHHAGIDALRRSLLDWERGVRSAEGGWGEEGGGWAGPSPLAHLTATNERAEALVSEVGRTARAYAAGLTLPPAKRGVPVTRRDESEACGGLAEAVHGLLLGTQLSGPSLQATLLLHAASADTVGLVALMQRIGDGQVCALPAAKPVVVTPPPPVEEVRGGGRAGATGAAAFDGGSTPSSTGTGSTGSRQQQQQQLTRGVPASPAPAGNPFGGAGPTKAPSQGTQPAGNPFGGGGTPPRSAAAPPVANGGVEPAARVPARAPAPAPSPAPAPAKKAKGNPFG